MKQATGDRSVMVMATQPLRFPLDQVIESVRPHFTMHAEADGTAVVYAPVAGAPDLGRAGVEGAVARAIVDLFPAAAGVRIAWRNRIDYAEGVDGQPVFGPSGHAGLVLGLGLEAMGPWVEHAAAVRLSRMLAGEAESVASWSIERFADRAASEEDLVRLGDRDGLAARRLAIS